MDRTLPFSIIRYTVVSFSDEISNITRNVFLMHEIHNDVTFNFNDKNSLKNKNVLLLNVKKFENFLKFLNEKFDTLFFLEAIKHDSFEQVKNANFAFSTSLIINLLKSIDNVTFNSIIRVDDRDFITQKLLNNSFLVRYSLRLRYKNHLEKYPFDFCSRFQLLHIKDLYTLFNTFFLKFVHYNENIDITISLNYLELKFLQTENIDVDIDSKNNILKNHSIRWENIGKLTYNIFVLLKSIIHFQENLISEDCLEFVLFKYFNIYYVSNFIETLKLSKFRNILFSYCFPEPFLLYSDVLNDFTSCFTNAEREIMEIMHKSKHDTFFYLAGSAHCSKLIHLITNKYPNAKIDSINTLDTDKNILKFLDSTDLFKNKNKMQRQEFLEKYFASFNYEKIPPNAHLVPYMLNPDNFSKTTKKIEDYELYKQSSAKHNNNNNKKRRVQSEERRRAHGNVFGIQQKIDMINSQLSALKSEHENVIDIKMQDNFILVKKYQYLSKQDCVFLKKYLNLELSNVPVIIDDLFFDFDLFKKKYCKISYCNLNSELFNNIRMIWPNLLEKFAETNTMVEEYERKIKTVNFEFLEKNKEYFLKNGENFIL